MLDPLSELTNILYEMNQDPMVRGLWASPNHKTTIDRMITCIQNIREMTGEYRQMMLKYESKIYELLQENSYLNKRIDAMIEDNNTNVTASP